MGLKIVILAAGRGKRMHSALPKVLQPLAGRPILSHVIDTARATHPEQIHIVHSPDADNLFAAFPEPELNWVMQPEPLGTGHAVQCVLPKLAEDDDVIILVGDAPLVTPETLTGLLEIGRPSGFGLVVSTVSNPSGLGRVIRNSAHSIVAIVEERDASAEQKKIREINTGIIYAKANLLQKWLPKLKNENAQKEYYLTDIFSMAVAEDVNVHSQSAPESSIGGINNKAELAKAERLYQMSQANKLMQAGLTLIDPQRFDVRGDLSIGKDVLIDINVICEGDVVIGNNCHIEPNCILRNVKLGDNTRVLANSVIENATIGDNCRIGPFARIRPGTELDAGVQIGNFVEVKKSHISTGSKANHLSYIGDTEIGKNVNVGAGTITCNYDGVNKHKTIIEDDAFIGSDTQLIAPVTVGRGATIAAGTTITKNVSPDALTLSRVAQKTITGWQRPQKKED